MAFATASAVAGVEGGRFCADVPDGWQQGRGAYGGLVIAYLVRAIEQFEGAPDKPLRSLTAALGGPLQTGAAEIRVERLRAGSSVVTLAARIEQGGDVPAHAVAILGKARGTDAPAIDMTPPNAPPWREVATVPTDAMFRPVFTQHFEMRFLPPAVFSGGEPIALGWVRTREPAAVKDAALVAALIDVWFPAELTRMTAMRPIATIAFSLQIIGGASVMVGDDPLLFRSRTLARSDGYLVEMRELWTERGDLVALNEQTIAIIK
jgi:Thioesterase-like superfamily